MTEVHIILNTAEKLDYIRTDTIVRSLVNRLCTGMVGQQIPKKGKIQDLIRYLRCRYSAAYLIPTENINKLTTESTIFQNCNTAIYEMHARSRQLVHSMIVKDRKPDVVGDKCQTQIDDYDFDVPTITTYFSHVVQEIFVEEAVIQPFLLRTGNLNFAALYSSFICTQNDLLQRGDHLCEEFQNFDDTSENRVVKFYSIYEKINGDTLAEFVIKSNDLSEWKMVLLQVFAALASVQEPGKVMFNHNDLHNRNVMVERHTHDLAFEYHLPRTQSAVQIQSKLRGVVIDPGLASAVLEKDGKKMIARSWYKQSLIDKGYPETTAGFDVFRLLTVLYEELLDRKRLKPKDKVLREKVKKYRNVVKYILGDIACEFVEEHPTKNLFTNRFLEYVRLRKNEAFYLEMRSFILNLSYEKAFYLIDECLFDNHDDMLTVTIDHAPESVGDPRLNEYENPIHIDMIQESGAVVLPGYQFGDNSEQLAQPIAHVAQPIPQPVAQPISQPIAQTVLSVGDHIPELEKSSMMSPSKSPQKGLAALLAEQSKPSKPSEPSELSIQSSYPSPPSYPSKISSQASQPSQPSQLSQPSPSSQPSQPSQLSQPSPSSQPSQLSQPSPSSQPSPPSQLLSQPSQPSQLSPISQPSKPSQLSPISQPSKPSQLLSPTSKPSQPLPPNSQPSQLLSPTPQPSQLLSQPSQPSQPLSPNSQPSQPSQMPLPSPTSQKISLDSELEKLKADLFQKYAKVNTAVNTPPPLPNALRFRNKHAEDRVIIVKEESDI
jgi:hypothetical protein